MAKGDQIVGLLEADTGVRAAMHLEPVAVSAQLADVHAALQREVSLSLPVGRP